MWEKRLPRKVYPIVSSKRGVLCFPTKRMKRDVFYVGTKPAHPLQMKFEGSNYYRLYTGLLVVVCLLISGVFVYSAWKKFIKSPIVVNVETTYYPLYEVPFPAVTICPAEAVNKLTGEELLLRYLNASLNDSIRNDLWNVMSAFSKSQYPSYDRAVFYLNRIPHLLPLFEGFNISEFMIKVLPKCNEVFARCFWQGREKNCCQILHLQRTEMGFCYSFNSLTSEKTKHCVAMDDRARERIKDDKICHLLHNTASGTITGFEAYLHPFRENESLRLGKPGVWIMHHDSIEFPSVGNFMFIPERYNKSFKVEILPYITVSAPEIRYLNISIRKCTFPDEGKISEMNAISENDCFLKCRLQYIAEKCGCIPYTFSVMPDILNATECSLSQMKCLARINWQLRFNKPPKGTRGFRDIDTIDCPKCKPTCEGIWYSANYAYNYARNDFAVNYSIAIDVYYKHTGAVKYHQYVAFSLMDLIVSFGGVVSLFLGVSLLSGLQFLYRCASVIHLLKPRCVKRKSRFNNHFYNN